MKRTVLLLSVLSITNLFANFDGGKTFEDIFQKGTSINASLPGVLQNVCKQYKADIAASRARAGIVLPPESQGRDNLIEVFENASDQLGNKDLDSGFSESESLLLNIRMNVFLDCQRGNLVTISGIGSTNGDVSLWKEYAVRGNIKVSIGKKETKIIISNGKAQFFFPETIKNRTDWSEAEMPLEDIEKLLEASKNNPVLESDRTITITFPTITDSSNFASPIGRDTNKVDCEMRDVKTVVELSSPLFADTYLAYVYTDKGRTSNIEPRDFIFGSSLVGLYDVKNKCVTGKHLKDVLGGIAELANREPRVIEAYHSLKFVYDEKSGDETVTVLNDYRPDLKASYAK